MSVSKVLQFTDKKDLECAICQSRFHQPKTLQCLHTYCLQCIQKCIETHGKMKCPTCRKEHHLTKNDLKKLASNTMISQLLEYVIKTEDQKPPKCSCCDNQPAYHCSTCQLYLCGSQCIEQHKLVPYTKDHPLYTLDMKEQDGISDKEAKCPADSNTTLEFYCSTCNKSAGTQCEKQDHKVIPMVNAIDEFNKDAIAVVNSAHEMESELMENLHVIAKYKSEFESKLKLCRKAIENQEKDLIKMVQEKSKELISDLEAIYEESKVIDCDCQIKDIDSKLTEVNNLKTSINAMITKVMINKPEEQESLGSYWETVNTVRDDLHKKDVNSSFTKRDNIPEFTPSPHVTELNEEGIGRVSTVDSMKYKVNIKGKAISVKKGELCVVRVSGPTRTNAHQLAATLKNSSGEESTTNVEDLGKAKYKITGRCTVKGDWLMKITVGGAHIEGSPVNINVIGRITLNRFRTSHSDISDSDISHSDSD